MDAATRSAHPTPPELEAVGLGFGFGGGVDDQAVLRDVSHRFGAGLTWLQGDEASGKTTLLRLLAGELRPGAGQLRCGGIDIAADPAGHRRRVVFCPAARLPAADRRPGEWLDELAQASPRFDRALAAALVDELGLAEFATRRIDQLSTGSDRKLAVLAALASGVPVLLLDEPLAGVDAASRRVLCAALAEWADSGRHVLVVASHTDLGEAGAAARVLRLPAR